MATPLQNFRAPVELWQAAGDALEDLAETRPVVVTLEPGMTTSEALRAFLSAVAGTR